MSVRSFPITHSSKLVKRLEIYAHEQSVYQYLADLKNQIVIQPFVCEVRVLKQQKSEKGWTELFFNTIEEFSVFGLVPFRRLQRCHMIFNPSDGYISLTIHCFPAIQIKAVFTIRKSAEERTQLKETLIIQTPVGINTYYKNAVSLKHNSILRTLKLKLEEQV